MSRQTFFSKNWIQFFFISNTSRMILKKFCCAVLSLSLALAPATSYGGVLQLLHFEWNYDTTLPDLAGYTMYQDGQPIFDINDPTLLNADWDVTLESGINSFTMTAFDTFGNESSLSDAYTLDVPPAEPSGNIPPVANIQASITSGDLPLSVNFDATGSVDYGGSIVDYSWDFGDGNVDSGSTVSNIFWNAGTFTVTLVVTDDEGASSTATSIITVNDPAPQNNSPTAAITVNASSGETPFLVNFDGTSSSDSDGTIVSYSWDLGDGNTATGDMYDYTYNTAGTYTATLTVTDNEGATDTAQKTITVTDPVVPNDPPVAAITATPLSGNSPLQVSFNGTGSSDSDGTITNYSWDFGDGNSASGSTTNHQYISGGTYTVILTVTDNSGDSDQETVSISVNSTPVANTASITTTEDNATSSILSATDVEGSALTYSIVTNGTKGTAAITNASTGALTYTPNANENGPDSFTFKVNDGQADSNTATISVSITAVNDIPVAADDSVTTNEDTAATVSVLTNDSDLDGDTLTVSAVTQGTNGTVATNGTTVIYTPAANWSGNDSFTYTVDDGNGGSDTATVSVTVTSDNDTPVAADDTATTNEDTAITVSVLANDSDADNDPLTISVVTQGTSGSVTTNGTNVTYTPNANANGTDNFTYTVDDGNGGTDTATVNITVTAINDIPAASNISVVTDEDIAASGLLPATDTDNDPLTYSIVANSSLGTATITNSATGAFTYTPNANISGSDSFTFKVNDGQIDSNTATVSVTINTVNDIPQASNASISTTEDNATSSTLSATDVEGSALTYSIVSNGAKGTAAITNAATGAFTYTPNANANGADAFTFKVNDGQADSNTATSSVSITAVNDTPVAADDSVTTNEDTAATISVLSNDPDLDGDTLTVSAVTQGSNGTVSTNGTTVTYTPAANWSGSDSFTYTVDDGNGGSDTATVSVTVTSDNDTPVAADDTATTNEDTSITVSVLANDSDADNDPLTISIVTQGTNGSVTTNGTTVTYTPNANANGTDNFTYTVDDGNGETDTATVSVTVTAINDIPAASNISVVTDEDITASGLLPATDADNDPLIYSVVANGSLGTATITNSATGAFTYTPNANISGSDSFTFKVNDGQTDSNTATVSVTINTVNDVPVANTASITTTEDNAVSDTLSATDVEGSALTYSIVTNGAKGTAAITNASTGAFSYTPNANANGSDSFTFKVNDGQADSNTATISVSITAVNDTPVAADDSATTNEDTAATISVLSNDSDLDGDTLTVSAVTQGTNGTVATNGTTVTYTPDADWSGTDSFTYTVDDGNGGSDTATVSVTVTSDNDTPVAADDTATTNEDTAITVSVLANDSDADNDPLTISIVTQGASGSVTTNGTTVTYTPNANANGTDNFTYTIDDGNGGTDTATVNITVTAINDIPTASNISVVTDEDIAASGLLPATDADNDPLIYSIVANGSLGTATITNSATGAFTYTPNANSSGSDSFTFKVNDGQIDSNTATVSVTINTVNDIPVANTASITTTEDNATSSTLSATDVEGSALTYSIVTNGAKGTAAITNAATGAFTYTPNANANGSDAFTFKVNDGQADSNTATISVSITAINDTPVASADSATTNEDTTATVSVLANDTDVDGDTLTVSAVTQGSNGTVATNGTTVTYTPAANWSGTDSFSYTIDDGNGGSDTASVTINVNDIPVATSNTFTIDEDTAISENLIASDQLGNALVYSVVNKASKGSVSLNSTTGAFTYTPNTNANGSDNFTFKANDGQADSNTGSITITIIPVNDLPISTDDSATTSIETPVSIAVLSNDSDVDGDTLTVTAVTQGTNGSVTTNGTTVVYTPNQNFYGTDSFTYVVSDSHGGIVETTVIVTVSAPFIGKPSTDTAPIASGALLTTSEDSSLSGKLTASDNDGDPLTYSIVRKGSIGSAILTNITTGAFDYKPNKNAFGTDTLTFKANDGQTDSNLATVTITITPVNDLPVTSPDSVIIDEDNQVSINVLANDHDVDDDPLFVSDVTQGDYGSSTISNNKIIYTPGQNFYGNDSFTYEVSDGQGGIVTETVTINILPTNDAPNASEVSLTITEDTILSNTLPASDPDGDILTYTIVDNPTAGKLSLSDAETGAYIYTPNINITGTDSFTFTATDNYGAMASGVVNIIILPANDAPLALDDKIVLNDYKEMIGKLPARDADDDILTYAIVDKPTKGNISYFDSETGSYVYTPNDDATETDVFTFTSNDGETESNVATITIIFNQPPVAIANGPYSGIVNVPIAFDAGNSYDPDGNIELYEWDWDNDGAFDESTASPKTSHIWAEPFNGNVVLKVTDNDGVTTMDSASVSITILGDLDADNTVDKDDYTIFRDKFRAAKRSCTGDSNFNAELDLDDDGCITRKDARLFRTLARR